MAPWFAHSSWNAAGRTWAQGAPRLHSGTQHRDGGIASSVGLGITETKFEDSKEFVP